MLTKGKCRNLNGRFSVSRSWEPMNLHFPYPRIFSLIQTAMPQAFSDASNSNTQSKLCLQQHCLAKHKNVQDFTVLHNSNQKCGMEQWMTVEISIKLKRKQPASFLLPLKPHCFIKTTHYIKSTNNDHFPFALKRANPKTCIIIQNSNIPGFTQSSIVW